MEAKALRRILVPLDGSTRAESSIPYATLLASVTGADITLMSVVEITNEQVEELYRSYLAGKAGQIEQQLRRLGQGASQVQVGTALVVGHAANEVLSLAERMESDLIVMTTFGRTGPTRWLMGTVAEKVFRASDIPVLVVRPAGIEAAEGREEISIGRILVPLDGSLVAEAALPYAMGVAAATNSEITITHVGPAEEEKITASTRMIRRLGEDGPASDTYWGVIEHRMGEQGLKVRTENKVGDAASEILAASTEVEADLIVMSTHGRTGLDRWSHGSVAEKVVRNSTVPVLVIPAKELKPSSLRLSGMKAKRCYQCGRIVWKDVLESGDFCPKCHARLRACSNCVHYDGYYCTLQRPEANAANPGDTCPMFIFRETTVALS